MLLELHIDGRLQRYYMFLNEMHESPLLDVHRRFHFTPTFDDQLIMPQIVLPYQFTKPEWDAIANKALESQSFTIQQWYNHEVDVPNMFGYIPRKEHNGSI